MQKESAEEDEEQKSTSKDADKEDIYGSETTQNKRMVRQEETFERVMNSMLEAIEVKCQEPQTTPTPRSVVNTERPILQPLSRGIGCEAKFEEQQASPPF